MSLLTETVATLTAMDVTPLRLNWVGTDTPSLTVSCWTCGDFEQVCDELGAKRDGGRWSSRGDHRIYDAVSKSGVVVDHLCWPHMACYTKAGAR